MAGERTQSDREREAEIGERKREIHGKRGEVIKKIKIIEIERELVVWEEER